MELIGSKNKEEMGRIIIEELAWRRKREFFKWHRDNHGAEGPSQGYPEAARKVNKNVLNKVISEYVL